MTIHSNILCWRIPWTEEPGGLYSPAAAAAAKSLQSCPTLCNPIDGSPPGSPVPGFLQARTLEWVAISFFNAWKWKVKVKSVGRVWLLATPWTTAYQAPPSLGFSRQEHWSGLPLSSPLHSSWGHKELDMTERLTHTHVPYHICDLQIYSPLRWIVFSFSSGVSWTTIVFNLKEAHLFFLLFLILVSYLRIFAKYKVTKIFPCVFFSEFYRFGVLWVCLLYLIEENSLKYS